MLCSLFVKEEKEHAIMTKLFTVVCNFFKPTDLCAVARAGKD